MNKSYKALIVSATAKFLVLFLAVFIFLKCQKEENSPPIQLKAEIQHVTEYGKNNGSIDLTVSGGSPPYAFLWSTNDTTENLTEIPAGIYTVNVTDKQLQTAADTFEILQPELEGVMDEDGNIYNIIKIGNQTWMQENLRVTHAPDGSAITSYVYGNDETNEEIYGHLYTWNVAMNGSTEEGAQGICPCGWHLPSDEEFKELEMHLGMTQAQADMENTWRGSPVGTLLKNGGDSGYDARLAGRRSPNGSFTLLGTMEYMWTSTEYENGMAWRRCLDVKTTTVGRWNTFPKTYGFSVRCVKDD